MPYQITIINTKAGNLTSLQASMQRLGHQSTIADTVEQISADTDILLLPGQGRFGPVMNTLNEQGFSEFLRQWHQQNKPILGICVGLQILFDSSDENPGVKGLSFLTGHVKRLNSPKQPMVGWCRVDSSNPIIEAGDAYFVNSYVIKDSPQQIAKTNYGESFCSAIQKNNLLAFQFHPEKSGSYGLQVLATCLNYLKESSPA